MKKRTDNSTIHVKLTKEGVRIFNISQKEMRDHINRYWCDTRKGTRMLKMFADVEYPFERSWMVWQFMELFSNSSIQNNICKIEDMWFEDERDDV